MNLLDASLIRYGIVGLGNSVVGLALIYLAKAVGIGDVAANAIGYGVGLTFSFVVNKRWTFGYIGSHVRSFVRFCLIIAIAYFANLGVVITSIDRIGLNGYLSQALGVPIYTLIGYLGCRFYVFAGDNEHVL